MRENLTIVGLDNVLGKFAKMDTRIQKELLDATEKSAVTIHKTMATYPKAMPAGRWARLTTPAQKRAFFWNLRRGGWDSRTMTLGRRWRYRVGKTTTGVYGIVLNRTSYSKWVQGATTQARVFRGMWKTTTQGVDENQKKIDRFYEHAVEQATK